MNKQDQMKLGLWLAEKKDDQWIRGKNDCCTFFHEWHDKLHGTNTLDKIYGKYNNLTGAIRFARKYYKVENWFPENGYTQVEEPQTGDIVMVEGSHFPSSYIICMNFAWSISDNAKRLTRHALDVPMGTYSIWRYTNGS